MGGGGGGGEGGGTQKRAKEPPEDARPSGSQTEEASGGMGQTGGQRNHQKMPARLVAKEGVPNKIKFYNKSFIVCFHS